MRCFNRKIHILNNLLQPFHRQFLQLTLRHLPTTVQTNPVHRHTVPLHRHALYQRRHAVRRQSWRRHRTHSRTNPWTLHTERERERRAGQCHRTEQQDRAARRPSSPSKYSGNNSTGCRRTVQRHCSVIALLFSSSTPTPPSVIVLVQCTIVVRYRERGMHRDRSDVM